MPPSGPAILGPALLGDTIERHRHGMDRPRVIPAARWRFRTLKWPTLGSASPWNGLVFVPRYLPPK